MGLRTMVQYQWTLIGFKGRGTDKRKGKQKGKSKGKSQPRQEQGQRETFRISAVSVFSLDIGPKTVPTRCVSTRWNRTMVQPRKVVKNILNKNYILKLNKVVNFLEVTVLNRLNNQKSAPDRNAKFVINNIYGIKLCACDISMIEENNMVNKVDDQNDDYMDEELVILDSGSDVSVLPKRHQRDLDETALGGQLQNCQGGSLEVARTKQAELFVQDSEGQGVILQHRLIVDAQITSRRQYFTRTNH